MLTPLKYQLSTGLNTLHVAGTVAPGHLAFQRDKLTIWLNEDLTQPKKERLIYVAMTGETVPYKHPLYIGTALNETGSFVQHAYEVGLERL